MLGCGIVSTGIKRVTTEQSSNTEPPTLYYTVFRYNFAGVMRTTRIKSACWWAEWTYQVLVTMNKFNYCFAHLFSIRLNSVSRLLYCASLSSRCAHLTITTKSSPRSLILCLRNISRTILLMQFRSTALGNIFFAAIIPSLAFCSSL